MHNIGIKASVVFLLFASAKSIRGEDQTPLFPADLILERFAVAKNGDCVLVPVRVADREYHFLLDTGAARSGFDTSIPLGQAIDVVRIVGSTGEFEAKLFHGPAVRVGRISFGPLDSVVGMDLHSLGQALGHPVKGILGMDFLGSVVVHLDADKGELVLLRSAPKNAGVELPISWEPGDLPFVTVGIGPGEPIRFMIDTGMRTFLSGNLRNLEIRSQVGKGRFRELGKTKIVTISGSQYRFLFQAVNLHIGEFTVQSPIFSESDTRTPNILGMRFWSRFTATFDFPRRKLYLRKSAKFDRPDRWHESGLHLSRKQGSIEVSAVDPGSPAFRSGLQKGDVLVKLNELNSDTTDLYDLRDSLCDGGQITCIVSRDSQERRLTITQTQRVP